MSEINFTSALTLDQCANVVMAAPKNRYILEGEPGVGKSSLGKIIAAKTGYPLAFIDVPNLDLGDTAMPVLDHETRTTRYYPNARFKLHEGKPVVIVLDEFAKGVDPVKNMLHPLLEVSDPRLGDVMVHPDSIILLTSNLASDGVGDSLKAHSKNRVIRLQTQKPDAAAWLAWAADNDIDPIVMAFVDQYNHCLASYLDGDQNENPYIFNPSKSQGAFLSPRSLERASNVLKTRVLIDEASCMAALKGAIGEAGARDMMAFVQYQDQLPKWADVISEPLKTAVPTSAGACAVMIFGAIQKVEKNSIGAFMDYVGRLSEEWQTIFCIQLSKNTNKQQVAFSSKKFADWVSENNDLL